nr:MAG: putative RNA-dependent RNA polymerase [Narnaviridae sp.]
MTHPNLFEYIALIDGILPRLIPVRPLWASRHDGVKQWLYVHRPGVSFELEVVETATTLGPPVFPCPARKTGSFWVLDDGTLTDVEPPPVQPDGRPLPSPREGETHYSVDFHLEASLYATRAVLLVLMDTCAVLARDDDHIGHASLCDVLPVLTAMRSWAEPDFIRNAKYWLSYPMASVLENLLPAVPASWTHSPSSPLFGGEVKAYWRRICTFDRRHKDFPQAVRAAFSIGQSKKGFAAVGAGFIKSSMESHAKDLSTPPPGDEPAFDPESLRIFCRSLFRGLRIPKIGLTLLRQEGSTSASAEVSRSEGGAREHLRALAAMDAGTTVNPDLLLAMREVSPGHVLTFRGMPTPSPEGWSRIGRTLLAGPDPIPASARAALQAYPIRTTLSPKQGPHTREELSFLGLPPDQIELLFSGRDPEDGTSVTEEPEGPDDIAPPRIPSFYPEVPSAEALLPDRVQKKVVELRNSDPEARFLPIARVAAVLEPLKVRLITAMIALWAFFARAVQHYLWNFLSEIPIFILTRRPVDTDVLYDLVTAHLSDGGSLDDLWVSGDFKAATDGLDIRATEIVLEEIITKLHPRDRLEFGPALRESLLAQILVYPESSGVDPVVQKNGQLMGSTLSFNALCTLNLYAYVMSRPDAQVVIRSPHRISRLPVRINGDDILFLASSAQYERWLSWIPRVGFVPSVGKNFIHSNFLTVNSELFWSRLRPQWPPAPPDDAPGTSALSWADEPILPDRAPPSLVITPLPVINIGLLLGQAKVTGKQSGPMSVREKPLSSWHADAVLGACNPPQAHGWFLHYHMRDIKRQTHLGPFALNLFAHPLLGGSGFTIPKGVVPRYSLEQRRLARALLDSYQGVYSGQPKDFKLVSLIQLPSESSGARLVGHRRQRVSVALVPPDLPLPQGYAPFEDTSGVTPLPLSLPYLGDDGDSDEEAPAKAPKLRLPHSALRRVARSLGKYVVSPLPVEEMTEFHLRPVSVEDYVLQPEGGRVPLDTKYDPPLHLIDVEVIPALPAPLPQADTPEPWELEDILLVLPAPELAESDLLAPGPVHGVTPVDLLPTAKATVPRSKGSTAARLAAARSFRHHMELDVPRSPSSRPFDHKGSRKGRLLH